MRAGADDVRAGLGDVCGITCAADPALLADNVDHPTCAATNDGRTVVVKVADADRNRRHAAALRLAGAAGVAVPKVLDRAAATCRPCWC